MPLVIPLDANGVIINVGDTVKLQGVVRQIDTADTHFGEIYIKVSFPVPLVPQPVVAGFNAWPPGAELHGPKADAIIQAPAQSLTH
jgi:hypothetical protein